MDVWRAGLPTGYRLERDADVITLCRPDESEVAYFSAEGATPEMVRLAAKEDRSGAQRSDDAPGGRPLYVRFLGRFELFWVGEPLPPCRNAKALGILKYLLAHPGRHVSRDLLMCWLWPEANLKKARWSLNSSVHALRRYLVANVPLWHEEPELVICEEGHYRLSPSLRPDSDVEKFDELYARGRRAEKKQGTGAAAEDFEIAVGLYGGDYLPEDLYEDWTLIERERLLDAYVYMLNRLCAHYLDVGNQQRAVEACYKLLEKDLGHEETHRRLISCYAGLGMRERARRQYRVCAHVLKSRYGLDPSPDTDAAYESVLTR
jgi:LuxR family transcriptional regulator, maltose regulon positive regulatory protein